MPPGPQVRDGLVGGARVNAMRAFVHPLPYAEKDERVATTPNPLIVGAVAEFFAPNDRVIVSARRR